MSDMLTHWASFDDTIRLASIDPEVSPDFSYAVNRHHDFARFGTLTRGGGTWMAPTIAAARSHWNEPDRPDKFERNLAFVLGGLVHQACDRVMKPVLTEAGGADWSEMQAVAQGSRAVAAARADEIAASQLASAYFDAEVFRQVYLGGEAEPFNRFFMADMRPAGHNFEDVARAMFQRALLAAHTLKPDTENMDAWLDNLAEKVQLLPVDVERWVEVFRNPDPARLEAYGVRTRFYRVDDPSIQAARTLQEGGSVDRALKREVLEHGASTCAYGGILQTGLAYLRSASSFWRGDSDAFTAPNYVRTSPGASQPSVA
jgi:hypothetical protein